MRAMRPMEKKGKEKKGDREGERGGRLKVD